MRVNGLKLSFAQLFAVRWQEFKADKNHPDLFNFGIFDRRRGSSAPP